MAALGRACQPCVTVTGARLALLMPRKVFPDIRIYHGAPQGHTRSHTERPRPLCVTRHLSTGDPENSIYIISILYTIFILTSPILQWKMLTISLTNLDSSAESLFFSRVGKPMPGRKPNALLLSIPREYFHYFYVYFLITSHIHQRFVQFTL